MYEFRDITDHTAIENPLPAEAVSVNGQYIENQISGYRTLYTKGRESLGVEVSAYSVGSANGERLKGTRYPARKLTVGFQLIAESDEDFRTKFNKLNEILSIQVADFIFNDETDKFFTGTPIMNAEVQTGRNMVKGEWQIYCTYPFKRSVDVKTLKMSDAVINGNTASWGIDYKGTVPAKPVLRAKFAPSTGGSLAEDGDCGYVAFSDEYANIIQLGNPAMIAYDDDLATVALINQNMTTMDGWQTTGGSGVSTVDGTMSAQDITDPLWNDGEGLTRPYAVPTYGSTATGEHGCVMWKTLSETATDFELKLMHKFCVENMAQTGSFHCYLQDANNNIVAGFKMVNGSNTEDTDIQFFVKGATANIEKHMIIYGNKQVGRYGYGYTTRLLGRPKERFFRINGKLVRKSVRMFEYATPSNLTVIRKHKGVVSVHMSGREMWDFKTSDKTPITKITMFFGAYGNQPRMDTNAVASVSLQKIVADSFADIPNVFLAGDVVEADCNDASVTLYRDGALNGYDAPQYGALGNNWEDFELTKGINAIQATWSDWVDPNYIPEVEIDYNEVFV